MNPQELARGDRVVTAYGRTARTGTVVAVDRYPMTYGGTYWIEVLWDGRSHPDRCLEVNVRRVR